MPETQGQVMSARPAVGIGHPKGLKAGRRGPGSPEYEFDVINSVDFSSMNCLTSGEFIKLFTIFSQSSTKACSSFDSGLFTLSLIFICHLLQLITDEHLNNTDSCIQIDLMIMNFNQHL